MEEISVLEKAVISAAIALPMSVALASTIMGSLFSLHYAHEWYLGNAKKNREEDKNYYGPLKWAGKIFVASLIATSIVAASAGLYIHHKKSSNKFCLHRSSQLYRK